MKKWGESSDGKVEYFTMARETAKEGLELLRIGFFPHENICVACEVASNPACCRELEELFLDDSEDISILAREKGTNQIVGVCYNKIQYKRHPEKRSYLEVFRDTRCKEKNSIAFINLILDVDALVDSFKKYNADCCLELMALATLPSYRGQGITTDLVKYTLALGTSLADSKKPNTPQICKAIFIAISLYKVGLKLKFDEQCMVKWSEMKYEGVTYDKKVDSKIHPNIVLMVKRL